MHYSWRQLVWRDLRMQLCAINLFESASEFPDNDLLQGIKISSGDFM